MKRVWELEWCEPTAKGGYKMRIFRNERAARKEFDRLSKIPGLNPRLDGYAK